MRRLPAQNHPSRRDRLQGQRLVQHRFAGLECVEEWLWCVEFFGLQRLELVEGLGLVKGIKGLGRFEGIELIQGLGLFEGVGFIERHGFERIWLEANDRLKRLTGREVFWLGQELTARQPACGRSCSE